MDLIPNELRLKIFSYLNLRDLCTLMLINRNYYNLTKDNYIWKDYLSEYGYTLPDNYYQAYKQYHQCSIYTLSCTRACETPKLLIYRSLKSAKNTLIEAFKNRPHGVIREMVYHELMTHGISASDIDIFYGQSSFGLKYISDDIRERVYVPYTKIISIIVDRIEKIEGDTHTYTLNPWTVYTITRHQILN